LDITAYGDSPLNSRSINEDNGTFGALLRHRGWISPTLIGLRSRHRCKQPLNGLANIPDQVKCGGLVTGPRARHPVDASCIRQLSAFALNAGGFQSTNYLLVQLLVTTTISE
ncbi:hypothetical protein ASPTUDRAFT_130979, partial [Aspergillus tubingensis CBS 134.48]